MIQAVYRLVVNGHKEQSSLLSESRILPAAGRPGKLNSSSVPLPHFGNFSPSVASLYL
jgi:hypothetical protein